MKKQIGVGLAIGFVTSVVGCAAAPRPTAVAAHVERIQCDRESASQDELVRSIHVLSVSPLYSARDDAEQHCGGSRRGRREELVVRPPQGV